MSKDNKHYLEKADLSISNLTNEGGLLNAEQTKEFMEIAIESSVLLSDVTTKPMGGPTFELSKMGFTGRVLRAAAESTALPVGSRSKPELGKVTLTTKEFICEARIPYGVVEDNVANGSFVDYAMQLLGKAVARDMEDVVVNGDTTSSTDPLFLFDGIIKQATTSVFSAGGIRLDKSVLKKISQTISSQFMDPNMVFYTSKNASIDYGDSLSNRNTQLGDDKVVRATENEYNGHRIKWIPKFPENLGGGTNMTVVLFCLPKNITVGIQRDVRIETDRDISARELIVVGTVRFDVKYAHEPAVVKATNVLATAG